MLNAALHYHPSQFQLPVIIDVKTNLHVDNIVSGADSEELAVTYYLEARSMIIEAKFNPRSWVSNSKQLKALAMYK